MTARVKKALAALKAADYKKLRVENPHFNMTEELSQTPFEQIRLIFFQTMLRAEVPVLHEDDFFGFNRYNSNVPYLVHPLTGRHYKGGGGNFTPNYARVIRSGFDAVLAQIRQRQAMILPTDHKQAFYRSMIAHIEEVYALSDRYRAAAQQAGNMRLAEALSRMPRQGAVSFYDACVFFKLLTFMLRCSSINHMTLGRFDQYMYPFYEADLKRGVSREELLETLELFFISLNLDSDLYVGMQQGDNGQSMVLGGYDADGNDMFNGLSELCMEASLALSLIDPKINLRVNSTTPLSRFEYATRLTKQGLGFPQYCNDDVVVPFLLSVGYEAQDAYDYAVAACWEHIVPNCACDMPNRATMNFPLVVDRALHRSLRDAKDFDALMAEVGAELRRECDYQRDFYTPESLGPRIYSTVYQFASLLIDGCIEKGLDLSQGAAKYNNFGCHGAGIATAADALAAVKQLVFEEKSVSAEELLSALDANFVGYESLQNRLLSCPKMGNNEESPDELACVLMEIFSSYLNGKPNHFFGGIWRAGTGSAMEYILSAKQCPATADGRRAGEPYGCSFSPAITTRLNGPLSVIQSFTKYDLKKIANGGPLTLELHDTVFRNAEGERKVAQLVQAFVQLGGHQLQLNAINRDRLLDAQAHPEQYPNLIVRVWGWSGYFCELDREYQDHIISRTEFTV